MRKRSKYRPRGVNPKAHIMAMQGAQRLNAEDRVHIMAPVQAAVDTIAAGRGERAQWSALFDVVNTLEQLLRRGLAKNWREWHEGAQQTIVDIMDRQKASGSRALHAAELAGLRDLVGVWADVVEVISCRELFAAQEAAARKVQQALVGNVPGARIVEAVA